MQQVAVMIGENLDFQVAGARQIFFQEYGRITEGGARFTLGFLQEDIELCGGMNDAHAAAAATHRRFHDDGIADLLRYLLRLRCRLDGILGSWQNRHPRGSCESASGGFVSEQFEKTRRRTYKGDTGLFADPGERGILGKKTVTGVDGVNTLLFCKCDDSRNVQIS